MPTVFKIPHLFQPIFRVVQNINIVKDHADTDPCMKTNR